MATELHVVTGDQYRTIDRRMREIKRQLDQENGSPLNPNTVAAALQVIVEGNLGAETQPTEMTIAGRTYEILGLLRGDEQSVPGSTMVERAKDMNANLGKDDGEFLLKHQQEIPVALRGKVAFVFTDWRIPDDPGHVAYVDWNGSRWVRNWRWLGRDWRGDDRVLRRK